MCTEESNKVLVRAFAEAGNRNKVDAFDGILAPDFVRHCEATPEVSVTSCEDFKQFYPVTAATFPDQRLDIESMVAEGDRVAIWGRIAKLWVTWDSLAGLAQLGYFPPPDPD